MKRSSREEREGRVVESRFAKILRRCSSSSSSLPPHLEQEEEEEEEDRISKLPDHLLVLILSLIFKGQDGKGGEIEQVVRSSVLSRRWRFLWTHSLKSLNFTLHQDPSVGKESKCIEFAHRVNRILALPVFTDDTTTTTTTTIDDFDLTVRPAFHGHVYPHIPSWINFALQKRVKRLTINVSSHPYFTLDSDVLIRGYCMHSLLSLCLDGVLVDGRFLKYLLQTTCPSLQRLSISGSDGLVDFTVSGPSLKLKYLKIHFCLQLKRLHIRNLVNLESFEYGNNNTEVVIEDTPRLVNGIFQYYGHSTNKVLSYLPRLQTLVLKFHDNFGLGTLPVFPKLMNLTKLELLLKHEVFTSAICAPLLVSCPSITQLILKFQYLIDWGYENKVGRLKHPHECLKVVQLFGFIGCKLDTGVALYIIENTLSLDKIVVDTSHPYKKRRRSMEDDLEDFFASLSPPPSESLMQEIADSYSQTRAQEIEDDIQARARAIAHAKQHLGERLSGTRTQIVVK